MDDDHAKPKPTPRELVEAAMQGFDYDAFYAREEQIMAMEDAAYERTKWPERAKRGRGPSAWHT